MEYNIEKASTDFIVLQRKGLNLGDLLYCAGLRAPCKKGFLVTARCSDISAMDISAKDVSARTFRPQTFRPRKMPKVDVSAKTINFGFGMCSCINV